MRTQEIWSQTRRQRAAFGSGLLLVFALTGCAYRLPIGMLPTQQRLKVVANTPELYTLRLRISKPHEYHVPADGRVTLDVPAYRAGCSVYLFDILRIRRGANPYKAKTLDIVVGGRTTRQLSLKEISTLPLDTDGYHLLRFPAAR